MGTIVEKNRLIAEFMGANKFKEFVNAEIFSYEMLGIIDCIEDGEYEKQFFLPSEMKFHSSWDWLMPVVNEVYNTGLDEQTTNEIGDITHALLDVNIIAVHEAVVKFIQMWNKQK